MRLLQFQTKETVARHSHFTFHISPHKISIFSMSTAFQLAIEVKICVDDIVVEHLYCIHCRFLGSWMLSWDTAKLLQLQLFPLYKGQGLQWVHWLFWMFKSVVKNTQRIHPIAYRDCGSCWMWCQDYNRRFGELQVIFPRVLCQGKKVLNNS